jgi:hypothetical protein
MALMPEELAFEADEGADMADWTWDYFSSSMFFKLSTKYSYKGCISKWPAIIVDMSKLIQALTMFWLDDMIDLERISPDT